MERKSGLKQRVVAEAIRAGAGAVRVVSASAELAARERMNAAFERGDFATWRYDARYASQATAPQDVLPGAVSIVCVALPYATRAPEGRAPLSGRISNYAWAPEDYHRKMRALLGLVASVLDEEAGASVTRVVCDTTPFAERAYAERAGLGWVGKHTNLIAPGLGSYVFLGEILTTTALEPDAPLRKSCGSCTRCVLACPTGALRGDYTIDARRCISDLTQRRDGIPLEWRALVGDWVWGCDICQDVCPPTSRAGLRGDRSREAPDAQSAFPDLQTLLFMGNAAFKRRFGGSALAWRGAAVLRRNAAVALGNTLDRAAAPALIRALREDAHVMVRGHAAWALGRIGSPQAFDALRRRVCEEPDPSVRGEIAGALEMFGNRKESP